MGLLKRFILYSLKNRIKREQLFSADESVALILVKHAFIENLANQQMAFI